MLKKPGLLFTIILCLVIGISITVMAEEYSPQNLTGKFQEIKEYKSLPNYNEAPSFSKLVNEGKLPPVEERLPKEPQITDKTMFDGIGEYGGVWRAGWGATVEGWNHMAGLGQGYFGIDQIIFESLIETGPMWVLENPEPVPNLAKDWEWSKDGKTLTMYLIEEARWSDGEPFTADDVLFTYYDNILDPQVTSPKTKDSWTFGGEVTELEKVDDYTIKWHFGKSFPYTVFYQMDYRDFDVAPAHVYKQYHPKYNDDLDYEEYTNIAPPKAVPPVVMGPWVPVRYEPEQIMIMVRNPYHYRVDKEGNQLPYLDEILYLYKGSDTGRTTAFLTGDVDMTNSADPSMFSSLLREEQNPEAPFRLNWDEPHMGFRLLMNQSVNLGISEDRDQALRNIFRDKKFRQAVSHIIDRDGVTNALHPGPQLRPWYGAFTSGALYYNEEDVAKFPYNLEKAKELLEELGFEDTDNDGYLNWPEGTLAENKTLAIPLMIGDDPQQLQIAEILVPLFEEAGIELILNSFEGSIISSRVNAGNWQMLLERPAGPAAPDLHRESVGSISENTPTWHISGSEGERELQDFENEIKELLDEATTAVDITRREEIFRKIQRLSTENVYTVPIYEYQAAYGIAKRFKNVPGDLPARLYQWNWTNLGPYQVWTPKENQIESKYQDLIPTSETYQERQKMLEARAK